MSEQILEKESMLTGAPIVKWLRVKQNMIGLPELIGLAFSILLVSITVLAYLYFLLPAQLRLKALQQERIETDKSIASFKKTVGDKATKEEQIKKIGDSVLGFEQTFLRNRAIGRMNLYQEINELIRRHNVHNTAGPNYTVLEPIDPNAPRTQSAKAGTARWQSLFPGITVSVTVEGPYSNIRRFIHDIEANDQFVIINSVQLEGQENSNSTPIFTGSDGGMVNPTDQPVNNVGQTTNIVSLRLDMAVYFQRGGLEDKSTEAVNNPTETTGKPTGTANKQATK